MKKRIKILNIWVDALTRLEAIQWVTDTLISAQRPHSIFAANPEKNFAARKDPDLLRVIKEADLLLPDGIGIVWGARLLFGVNLERIPGAEFIEDICEIAAEKGYKIFLYGAKEEVNLKSAAILQERYPGLKVAGRANGYLSSGDMPGLIKKINDSRAEILFIALGSPKQEKWFAAHSSALEHVRIVQGIGGTLDTIVGKVRRAPEIWRKHSAEWLYRLLSEPSRIRRQKVLPLFALEVLGVKIGRLFGFTEEK
jgi:N-acetylglucosaminyldiphosphoundecaprenol N-acetyl-beta-D-mannosaminyltransferase